MCTSVTGGDEFSFFLRAREGVFVDAREYYDAMTLASQFGLMGRDEFSARAETYLALHRDPQVKGRHACRPEETRSRLPDRSRGHYPVAAT
jgi:hypothetical protein